MEREGEFEFDFSKSSSYLKLDDKNKRLPQSAKLVDFVVELRNELHLIEIKDPSCAPKKPDAAAQKAISEERERFVKKMQNDELIANELTPKARDSYCILHLMKRDQKPMFYTVLLGSKELTLDPALLMNFQERLSKRLQHEMDEPWARPYVEGCAVVTEETWPDVFHEFPMKRVPQGA